MGGKAGTAVSAVGTTYSQTRVAGWGTGTAVPDTAASYTSPPTHFNRKPERKAYPRTTARGGSKEREREHGCARDSGIIHSTEGTCPAHNNVWRQKGEEKRVRLSQILRHHIYIYIYIYIYIFLSQYPSQ